VNEAQAVSSITAERPTAKDGTFLWVLRWKDHSQAIEINLAMPDGQLCWKWLADGVSPSKSRPPTDVDETFIQRLVITLADQTAWRAGGFPNL